MMKSGLQLVIRRICLRKGPSIALIIVCILGFFGIYHFSSTTTAGKDLQVDASLPRDVKVVSESG